MNRSEGTPIHWSNLVQGKQYYYKNKSGEAVVEILEQQMEGWYVEIKEGGFAPPLRKRIGRGDTMLVKDGVGTFYEVSE